MDVKAFDKNFAYADDEAGALTEYGIRDGLDLYGVFFDEANGRFYRFPDKTAEKVSVGVRNFNAYTAGGRLRFSTDSETFKLSVKYDGYNFMSTMPLCSSSGFVLIEESGENYKFLHILTPELSDKNGFERTRKLSGGGMRNYILYFPLYNGIRELSVGFDKGSTVTHGKKYRDMPPILYYGSSITEGACATRPDNSYEAFISRWNNIDFINLGFGGQARGESIMADYLSTVDCSLFVCDYDYNAPDAEHLKNTHYDFYARYRNKRPYVPILFLTKPDIDTNSYGAKERVGIIKNTFLRAKKNGDENVYFLDGKNLFGKSDRVSCTVDGCHPNDLGYYKMAECIYRKMVKIDRRFK